ncbi:alkylhydroperoxidase [Enterovibrio norvegicus]|uniref:Alkylhydroperoxidase AhpD family core domain-containing protein n=2 Tax=Enterovibrio norvegicus TaxID=188144 RepID=A0A1I5UKQ9_9GAMM|nr:carboxymuconolactone decarboxylase family protein [Enterovibrio norvegicus]MCC4798829.1 carboxymuconolactone decarboxylase family protein [Enterovibrio norvegicus]OEE46391.1 alkylhydroperoxidase [Enterovibrio norvegicus]OEF57455.1 alkylhydroperoxidase [Enterovibrio norvegicus]OEF60789.1 alkylhydroperoxidase [Enterovibrio norvegicus]PMH62827.1 alkylhydroperoxidase [Enterovibrio norvegicus]
MHNMDNLKKLSKLKDHAKPATDGFWQYDNAALADGAIPKKYKELIAIAVGLTTQCVYCIEAHKGAALKAGATAEEFAEVVHIAAAIRAGGAITHGTHLFD